MKTKTLALAAGLLMALTGGASADDIRTDTRAVVELFTSQGCSSCPPADAVMKDLAGRDDVVALAYHVDYWDYIGWADTFGDASFSDWQRAYAKSWGKTSIYTPQMVVNGQTDVIGSHRGEVEGLLGAAHLPVEMNLAYHDGMLEADIPGDPDQAGAVVWLVTYKNNASVAIERGENSGRTISYSRIVTGRQAVGMWDPHTGASVKLPLDDILGDTSDGAAVLVQRETDGLPGPILAAASVTL